MASHGGRSAVPGRKKIEKRRAETRGRHTPLGGDNVTGCFGLGSLPWYREPRASGLARTVAALRAADVSICIKRFYVVFSRERAPRRGTLSFFCCGPPGAERDLDFRTGRQIVPRIPKWPKAGIFTVALVDNKFNYASLSFKAVQSLPGTTGLRA